MAFVSEEIKEEDKEYFNSIGFTYLMGGKKVVPFWWVIDREREIVLTSRGRVIGEGTKGYQLYYRKELINIELLQKGSGDYAEKSVVCNYKIQKVEIPKQFIKKGGSVEEAEKVIKEAFIAAGEFGFEQEVTIKTTVDIEKEPVIL